MTINITPDGLMNVAVHVPTPAGKGRGAHGASLLPVERGALIGALHKLVEEGLVSVVRSAGWPLQ